MYCVVMPDAVLMRNAIWIYLRESQAMRSTFSGSVDCLWRLHFKKDLLLCYTGMCVPSDFRLSCRALQGAERTLFPGDSFGGATAGSPRSVALINRNMVCGPLMLVARYSWQGRGINNLSMFDIFHYSLCFVEEGNNHQCKKEVVVAYVRTWSQMWRRNAAGEYTPEQL